MAKTIEVGTYQNGHFVLVLFSVSPAVHQLGLVAATKGCRSHCDNQLMDAGPPCEQHCEKVAI